MSDMSESRICQNCKQNFVIEPDDFSFYEKIKVPPPTFCPECRTIRRLCWRNEMSLFRRKCDVPGHKEMLISFYPPEEKLVIYDSKSWWGDGWDALSYGREYDFSKSFFEQWKELRDVFPLQHLSNSNATNSDYCNIAEDSKNSYMSSGSWKIEQTHYSNRIFFTKDSSDLYIVQNSELCYDDVMCSDCYHLMYSLNCKNCVDSYFLYDCIGCTDCFGCSNLRNKSYCIWNEQFSREEYKSRLEEMNLMDFNVIEKFKLHFKEIYLKSIHRFATQIKCVNSTGENLNGVKNCKSCFDSSGQIEDSKYVHWSKMNLKDTYDSGPGVGMGELMYETFDTGIGNFRNLFTSVVYSSNDIEYCFNCHGSSNLFGCIGLRNKKYCILNKQYTKEEYEELVISIKKQMMEVPYVDKKGIVYKYGEFFPSELSPFCYNETQAQDYFPTTREKALENGYRWRDRKNTEYQITIKAKDLPDNFDDNKIDITKEVIGCLHEENCQDRCKGAYKIIEDELNLYKRLGVPLPRLCFFCRHESRLRMRTPMKLWHRSCMKEGCTNEFETSYAPERPEIVYCEKCYQQEVY
ncbi:hypothetical protein A2467_01805 [Candidatus Nomurabacteria bacterium RIFOXYC2_FULL_36_8]|nr:MAG: hypothetical protein UR97_C0005G0033 [Candidatus Nomurabacteria bacterium GW2011_GWE2_36_115]KKP93748.1 MAG: hypothetical protein US00_C0005G0033 [Candidatus Nomurabacteria bacterium GW2011_GWF2_36_126]KKP99210.1 MAG: hypothetical protein US08_C0002G0033 [Candidatus Nomurabacteria bacterium GW2011_GWF2_36_19]KKQ05857.1 MAG: hypothetical protein US17_C0001G0035 [Candidatus Nomurabacteria bacterium GW2011_GWF1_36_47]KKQ12597.1 MAG: hypothetical protein US26_C0006G0014 [Candidatus Nomuraba